MSQVDTVQSLKILDLLTAVSCVFEKDLLKVHADRLGIKLKLEDETSESKTETKSGIDEFDDEHEDRDIRKNPLAARQLKEFLSGV